MDPFTILAVGASLTATIFVASKVFIDWLDAREAKARVAKAEESAFKYTDPERGNRQVTDPERGNEQVSPQQIAQAPLQTANLFDLYSKQIEKYQTETQSRAGWSFIFAIIAMTAGLLFVMWGGTVIFSNGDWKKVAAGSAISAIGGAVSAFITKTFLDVHKLSLSQLNRYFRQPVLNAHILTAQRLADSLDEPTKRLAYENIIESVIALITEDDHDALSQRAPTVVTYPRTKRTAVKKAEAAPQP